MQIEVIEPHEVHTVWPHIKRHIEAAQRRGPTDHDIDQLRRYCCCMADWRLVVLEMGEGAAIIRILNDRLHVVSLGGNLPKGWAPLFAEWLTNCGIYCELQGITLCGRKGWARKLAPLGFKPIGGGWLEARFA